MFRAVYRSLQQRLSDLQLPPAARLERRAEQGATTGTDPGIRASVDASLDWIARAQDRSATADGGFARHFSLVSGWASSYPETTGYIIPTLLAAADTLDRPQLRERARRALDWLVRIQLPEGAFQGGTVDARPVVPVTFNTGQILMGLSAGARVFGDAYVEPMRRAADWLVLTQDRDGCWRKYPTPFARPGLKAYETHVAWGLLEAAQVSGDVRYAEAALRNVDWALTRQQPNGWFAENCLDEPERPLTHTIGYALRGVLEAYRYSREHRLLEAAERTSESLLGVQGEDGFLSGRLRADWSGAVSWACLTGIVQIAHCWLLLRGETGDQRCFEAAARGNAYVRHTVRVVGDADLRGGVKGSFPVDGAYGRFQYLNWATKFFIDSNLLEESTRSNTTGTRASDRGASGRDIPVTRARGV